RSGKFEKQLQKLNRSVAKDILQFMYAKLEGIENPRSIGKSLKGNLQGLWRYRIGDYRLICQIQDEKLIVLAVEIAHRKDVYKGK
ncbi:MAG: type II toxin-antitoxin system RelE/ParE family toxin, partial [Tannerella sp.]|nr:type II toxin-antitoxin system RelE/ParE family toxin [Tannerella sp.]